MRNGESVKYDRGLYLIKRGKQEFLMRPGDQLTMVPVIKPKRFSALRNFWYRIAPEVYRTYRRRRSHLAFLDKNGVTDKRLRSYFGSQSHIADETLRALKMPPIELNDFDCRKRTSSERRALIQQTIRNAIKDSTKSK